MSLLSLARAASLLSLQTLLSLSFSMGTVLIIAAWRARTSSLSASLSCLRRTLSPGKTSIQNLLPASGDGPQVLRDIEDGIPVSVTVVLGTLSVEVNGLHGPHEGVPHPHPILHYHVQVLGGHDPVPYESPALIEQRILHPD